MTLPVALPLLLVVRDRVIVHARRTELGMLLLLPVFERRPVFLRRIR